ncbi:hypothetical protein [Clostridium thermarum]|uniref:hypothetical protein n=1 Tax=Clostridium thermarum TaxID=1716543 RepID=UPI001121F7E8|nr:hypothetical protein [Clostridium thermarum]
MNLELKAALNSYRQYTIELLEAIEKDQIDSLEGLLGKRQELIEQINTIKYDKKEFNLMCSQYKLPALEQKLTMMTKAKLDLSKRDMEKFQEMKTASKSYNKNLNNDSIFFNKKI